MALEEPVDQSLVPPHREGSDLSLDKVTFGVAAALAISFLLWGVLDSEGMGTTTGDILGWLETTFGWLFILVSASFLLFSAYLALTRYGNIKLGPDDSEPEFSTFSWVSMMFATGHGHRPDVLGRRRAADLPHRDRRLEHPAGPRRPVDPRQRPRRHGVRLLPLGLPPVVHVRRDRARDRLLRLPQGHRQPGLGRVRPPPGAPRDRGPGQGDRRHRDLRDALRLRHLPGPGRPADHRRPRRRVRHR